MLLRDIGENGPMTMRHRPQVYDERQEGGQGVRHDRGRGRAIDRVAEATDGADRSNSNEKSLSIAGRALGY
jgi:hypothetical protein